MRRRVGCRERNGWVGSEQRALCTVSADSHSHSDGVHSVSVSGHGMAKAHCVSPFLPSSALLFTAPIPVLVALCAGPVGWIHQFHGTNSQRETAEGAANDPQGRPCDRLLGLSAPVPPLTSFASIRSLLLCVPLLSGRLMLIFFIATPTTAHVSVAFLCRGRRHR